MAIRDKNIDKNSGNANFAQQIVALRNGPQTPASQTDLEVMSVRLPWAGKFLSAHVFCRAKSGTVTAKIHKNAATILTGDITPVAGAQTAGTLASTTTFAAGDELQLLVTTAGASTVDDLVATVILRPNLQD
ncbi:MAG: hypothetical protein ACE5DX_05765, partial [Candidatus Dojkabacteria bacterium]